MTCNTERCIAMNATTTPAFQVRTAGRLLLLLSALAANCTKPASPATPRATTIPPSDSVSVATPATFFADHNTPESLGVAPLQDPNPEKLLQLASGVLDFTLYLDFDESTDDILVPETNEYVANEWDERTYRSSSPIVLAIRTAQQPLLLCWDEFDEAGTRKLLCVEPHQSFALSIKNIDAYLDDEPSSDRQVAVPPQVKAILDEANRQFSAFENGWTNIESKGAQLEITAKRIAKNYSVYILNRWTAHLEKDSWKFEQDDGWIKACNTILYKAAQQFAKRAPKIYPRYKTLGWNASPSDDVGTATVEVHPGRTWRFRASAVSRSNLVAYENPDAPTYEKYWRGNAEHDWLEQRIVNGLQLTVEVETEKSQFDLEDHPLVQAWSALMRKSLEQCRR
jgi:hypothetical protein